MTVGLAPLDTVVGGDSMISILVDEVERDTKDSGRLKAIQSFLEDCYELPSLQAVRQRLMGVSKLQKEAISYLRQARLCSNRAAQIANEQSEEITVVFLEEIEKLYLNIQQYKKITIEKFKLLTNIIEECWDGLPSELQQLFDNWAKDLTVYTTQEKTKELQKPEIGGLQRLIEIVSSYESELIKEAVDRLKQLVDDEGDARFTNARLNFAASVFRQTIPHEEKTFRILRGKNVPKLSEEQIYELGMKTFDKFLEDYGDVLDALAER